jgi:hypothetical protein
VSRGAVGHAWRVSDDTHRELLEFSPVWLYAVQRESCFVEYRSNVGQIGNRSVVP